MASCPCKPRKFDIGCDENGQSVLQVLLDPTGLLLNSPHWYYPDGTVTDAAGGAVAAPEYASWAEVNAASVAYCAPGAVTTTILMIDDDDKPVIVTLTDGVPTSGIYPDGSPYTGDLGDLDEPDDQNVYTTNALPYCVNGGNAIRTELTEYDSDPTSNSNATVVATTIVWTTLAGAAITPAPDESSDEVNQGACEVRAKPNFTPFC